MLTNNHRIAAALAVAVFLAGGVTTARAQATEESLACASSKQKAAGKDVAAKLKCYSKAVQKGLAVDPLCLSKAEAKTTQSFQKADDKGGCATDANAFDINGPTAGTGDGIPDGMLGSILNVINLGYPTISGLDDITADAIPNPTTPSKCTSKKVNALSKFAGSLYNCESKVAKKNEPSDPACVDKATMKFNQAVTKEEAKDTDKNTTGIQNDCQTLGDGEFLSGEVFRNFGRVVSNLPRLNGCGNGMVTTASPFPIESCDDGNIDNNDSCPSDCTIDACTPTTNPRPATVTISDPNVAVVLLVVDYPEGKVTLPGLGFDADTTPLVGGSLEPLDFEHAVQLLASDAAAFGATQIATLNFDDCQGATPPVPADFQCTVLQAGGPGGVPSLPSTTCSVTVP